MNIALVVSDVDGTLVTTDKRLTPATIDAVKRLDAAGIAFTVASARPPIGFKALVEPLNLRLPMGAFNGGTLVGPDLVPFSQTTIPESTAREAVDHLLRAGIDVWVFADGTWTLRDPGAPYADLERRTLGVEPTVVSDLGPLLGKAQKIVGVSGDADELARVESQLSAALGERAAIERSQAYYLDITPPGVSKGGFVLEMSRRLGIAPARIATLGDAGNDVAMFRVSGRSIAMGNAKAEVRAAASAVTASNDEDGFAQAIERIVLG
ncbi:MULTISPECIES: HAD family hydrolase [Methylobacterium]|uniref:Phosphatase n=1 Tax=Methylobacterium thuringiense TaxID=1003091 RepID=A0ABQ4TQE1_9HYPH|nr:MULTISPECIES: HAD family hydrolase [Methylobacterium]TXN20891.1 HAD family hydrolase [Methylobacterium sp. WL9]GJE56063.1 Putative phosphatase [Methylobacterium thuringiense]